MQRSRSLRSAGMPDKLDALTGRGRGMRVKGIWTLLGGLAALAAVHGPAATGAEPRASVGPVLWQPSMNVFRRFAVDQESMFEFYGEVLGFEQLATLNPGGGTSVARFQAGGSELKLTAKVADRNYVPGGVRAATGERLLTFSFPDEAALVARFAEHGLPAPQFTAHGTDGRRSALVVDPDGQAVELIVIPDAPPATYAQIEVGLTVSDIDASRAFYREFVGLEELEPVHDPVFDTMKYSYRHGTTVVSLRSFGAGLPADTGSGGIQYVVSDADLVDALARERNITVDQPLSTLGGFQLRTIWLDDPDGITNYFAETAQARAARPHE
jgi:catechol 2,3-dioxygenase-like lactoylglutathione lyase family enzyme